MPCHIITHQAPAYLEMRMEGQVSPAELLSGIEETIRLVRSGHSPLILGDCRQLVGGHSIGDLYALAELILAQGSIASFKEAVLMPVQPDQLHLARFWETSCLNRGLTVKVFSEREAALAWLLS